MWIARDFDGTLCLYSSLPQRHPALPFWDAKGGSWMKISPRLFSMASWNRSPIYVKIKKAGKNDQQLPSVLWIAENYDTTQYLFKECPYRDYLLGSWTTKGNDSVSVSNENRMNGLSWESNYPVKVKLVCGNQIRFKDDTRKYGEM